MESQSSNSAVPEPVEAPPSYSDLYDSDKYGESQIPYVTPITEYLRLCQMVLMSVPPYCPSIFLRVI